jgi:sugar (pentulose or hexulose) kinase
MEAEFLIGLDYGSESARGVLVDASSGEIAASHAQPYRHGVMTTALPNGRPLPPEWALQNAPDYEEVAEALLAALGRGRRVRGMGRLHRELADANRARRIPAVGYASRRTARLRQAMEASLSPTLGGSDQRARRLISEQLRR